MCLYRSDVILNNKILINNIYEFTYIYVNIYIIYMSSLSIKYTLDIFLYIPILFKFV